MNIGIDIDGTLTKYPDFFMELGRQWKAAGHEVYLITGLGKDGIEKRIRERPYLADSSFYTTIVHTGAYNDEEKALIGLVEDNELIVGRFKQRMCRELGVAVMFDDQAQKHRAFGSVPIFEVK